MRRLIIGLLALAWTPAAFAQHNHGPHEHGAAELRVALDGQTLLVEFASPLDNLVGFEHAPRDQQQRDDLAGAEQTLARFDRLFALPAAAACTLRATHLESPWPRGDDRHGDGHRPEQGDTHVLPDKPIPGEWDMTPVWVVGKLAVTRFDSSLGNAGYQLRALTVEEYQETPPD